MTSLACIEPSATRHVETVGVSSIEAMARSRHDRLQAGPEPVAWEETEPDYRDQIRREAAADLLALVEALRPLLR